MGSLHALQLESIKRSQGSRQHRQTIAIVTVFLLTLASSFSIAQEPEIWNCLGIDGIGFRDTGTWGKQVFQPMNLTLTINGSESELSLEQLDGAKLPLACFEKGMTVSHTRCENASGMTIILGENGEAALSMLMGVAMQPSNTPRDSIQVHLFQCSKTDSKAH